MSLLIALTSVFPSRAQDAIGPFISTVGTTTREAGTGREWACLLWTANASTLLAGRAHAIYSKPGDANANAPFTRVAIVSLQSEAITLAPLLARAALLGEVTNTLHEDINALFGRFVPDNLSLPEKLSAVVRGALQEEKHFGRLILLSRTHPSVAMALGFGHAELIPAGQTTFEIREFERATQTDGAVIGRVTVTAGAPVVLPAPGTPVALNHDNARGHLNAQLRWATPDALRRLSLLQHGYNVWRVRKDFADARNWGSTPPPAAALVSNSIATTVVKRLNYLPLLTPTNLTAIQAADTLADPKTFFVVDDNDRGRSNIITSLDFTNGARFYYFVTARDILGRDGLVSPGKEVQICNKLPPDALEGLTVENDYMWLPPTNRQRLRVIWPQSPNLPLAEQKIKSYWVYRWDSVAELRLKQANRTNGLIAVINHIPGQTTNSYLDAGAGAPTPQNDSGKTFWYTVRMEDDGACQGNLSPHSAPAFGVLRDRTGPKAPVGEVRSVCYDPDVTLYGTATNGSASSGTLDSTYQVTMLGFQGNRLISWMELRTEARLRGSTNVAHAFAHPRQYFSGGFLGSLISFPFDIPSSPTGYELQVSATVGFANGETASTTESVDLLSKMQPGDLRLLLYFRGGLKPQPKDVPCTRHFPVGPAEEFQPVEVVIEPTPGSKEVRVYRRVDDGPLDLIYQRPVGSLNLIVIPDEALPHGGGKICYYACMLDEHGNSSALSLLDCKLAFENNAPPKPQLSPITTLGTQSDAQMVVSWFCPSANVDRFEVGIAGVGEPISSNCAPGYLLYLQPPAEPPVENLPTPIFSEVGLPTLQPLYEFSRFLTPHVGANFGEGDHFSVRVDVQVGRRYIVYVKAIARSGNRGDRSNVETFFWQEIVPPLPNVPWPARALPPVGNSFDVGFPASLQLPCGETNGPMVPTVRLSPLGYADRGDECPQKLGSRLIGDPNNLLPKNTSGESLLPVVLYRQQVTNSSFPAVTGDVTQVTPMMESIAWGVNSGDSVIYDPFILLGRTATGEGSGIFLRDTQPVVSGARYRYFLARFNKLGELSEVIPAGNELEVP